MAASNPKRFACYELRILTEAALPDLYIVSFILFGIFVSVMLAGRYGRPRGP